MKMRRGKMKLRNKQNILSLGLLAAFLLLPACASITSLTTAKTLKEGDLEVTAAAGYSNLKLKIDEDDISGGNPDFKVFVVDIAGRYGITDQDELGLRAVNIGYFMGDYKRSLIASSAFGLSAGAGLGYTSWTLGSS